MKFNKKAAPLVALILGLIVLLVMMFVVANTIFAGTQSATLSANQVITQNKQCLAFSQTLLARGELTDTDGDEMADVCDMCPNNFLSDEDDDFNTDQDEDGLSEEGLRDAPLSPYNRNNYDVNKCDKEILRGIDPQCYNELDTVRGQCNCDSSKGWGKKDICVSSARLQALQQEHAIEIIRQKIQRIHDFAITLNAIGTINAIQELREEVDIPLPEYLNTLERLYTLKSQPDLTPEELDEIRIIAVTEHDIEYLDDRNIRYLINAVAYLELMDHDEYFIDKRYAATRAQDQLNIISTSTGTSRGIIKRNLNTRLQRESRDVARMLMSQPVLRATTQRQQGATDIIRMTYSDGLIVELDFEIGLTANAMLENTILSLEQEEAVDSHIIDFALRDVEEYCEKVTWCTNLVSFTLNGQPQQIDLPEFLDSFQVVDLYELAQEHIEKGKRDRPGLSGPNLKYREAVVRYAEFIERVDYREGFPHTQVMLSESLQAIGAFASLSGFNPQEKDKIKEIVNNYAQTARTADLRAAAYLALAEIYTTEFNNQQAIEITQQILDEYPSSSSAERARELNQRVRRFQ